MTGTELARHREKVVRISTGSKMFDSLLGGHDHINVIEITTTDGVYLKQVEYRPCPLQKVENCLAQS